MTDEPEELDADAEWWDLSFAGGPDGVPVSRAVADTITAEARKGSRELTDYQDIHGDTFRVRPADVKFLGQSTAEGRRRLARLQAELERQRETDSLG